MKIFWLLVASLWLSFSAWGRGGGGCLAEGTLIATPTGPVTIERLRPGDVVLSPTKGGLQPVRVLLCFRVEPDEFISLTAGGHTIFATPEHPMGNEPEVFRLASVLKPGDSLLIRQQDGLHTAELERVGRVPANRPAYNLLVSRGGTFLANDVVVHNKGCFLPDTPVLRADGTETQISAIQPGDDVLAFTADGQVLHSRVREVIVHEVGEYWTVVTGQRVLRVTAEHPFYVGMGTFKTLAVLHVGDTVYAYDGNGLSPQKIKSMERVVAPTKVFNLQTDVPNTFFADGIAVHNKGGCFPAGTKVLTPAGEVAIEQLLMGDEIVSIAPDGRAKRARVREIHGQRARVLVLETDQGALRTTAEHPLLCGDLEFRPAGEIFPGDEIMKWNSDRWENARVLRRTVEAGESVVFNLAVDEPHTFVADGFIAHNKGGGCFPAGTMVLTDQGERRIESLQPGNVVLSTDDRDRLVAAVVEKVMATHSRLMVLRTEAGVLRTTAEHPLQLRRRGFVNAAQIQPGDEVQVWRQGGFQLAKVISVADTRTQAEVFNLRVSAPHTFIADGFLVHNKGGGFHGGGGSGGGTASPAEMAIVLTFFGGLVIFVLVQNARQMRGNLDYVYSRAAIKPKADKTKKLLEFIAKVDPAMAAEKLEQTASSTFMRLQQCWQARRYEPMKPLLMSDLYADHVNQLAGMKRDHEVNMIAELRLRSVDIVNVRYTEKEEQREFTALITASARDYYVDDRTNEFVRGDEAAAEFQEFWTFQLWCGTWRLREIEQSRESDTLKEENFFEQFTDTGVNQVYGETAGKEGPAGPWLEKPVETKEQRTERLLNFLVQTDKLWDRQKMLQRARQIFLEVTLAREAGDAQRIPKAALFPEVIQSLQADIEENRKSGRAIEFRNLCVRKVELVLVRNFADNSRDEFIVRIRAHAQQIRRLGGVVVTQDEDVTPYEEFWTFGRLDAAWKLRGVMPSAAGQAAVRAENTDEDSSPQQVQWYYDQTRAV